MAAAFQDAWQWVPHYRDLIRSSTDLIYCRHALHTEKELLEALADRDPTFAEITHLLSESVLRL